MTIRDQYIRLLTDDNVPSSELDLMWFDSLPQEGQELVVRQMRGEFVSEDDKDKLTAMILLSYKTRVPDEEFWENGGNST